MKNCSHDPHFHLNHHQAHGNIWSHHHHYRKINDQRSYSKRRNLNCPGEDLQAPHGSADQLIRLNNQRVTRAPLDRIIIRVITETRVAAPWMGVQCSIVTSLTGQKRVEGEKCGTQVWYPYHYGKTINDWQHLNVSYSVDVYPNSAPSDWVYIDLNEGPRSHVWPGAGPFRKIQVQNKRMFTYCVYLRRVNSKCTKLYIGYLNWTIVVLHAFKDDFLLCKDLVSL